MILEPGFEKRTEDAVRRLTDDIAECERAEIKVIWRGAIPLVRFRFTDPRLPAGCPMLAVQLVTESRKNPLAPGRVVAGDELRRHVRDSVENYFRHNGIETTKKAFTS
jgi:hypothetical protein